MAKFVHHDEHGKKVVRQKIFMRVKNVITKLLLSVQFILICYLVLKANNLV